MQDSSQYEEQELLALLHRGSEQAFEKIYNHYSIRLYANLLKLVKSEAEAQEILQDVFLKVWNNREQIDLSKSFKAYLFKIAENKVYDFFRKLARDKKKMAVLLTTTSGENVPDEANLFTEENTALLEKAIGALPPQRQQVFRLCKLEGKSYREVSKELDISESTISDHIVKATKSIRIYFENNEQALLGLLALAFCAS